MQVYVCVCMCMSVGVCQECMCAQYVSIPATATVARPERIAPMADVMATLECVCIRSVLGCVWMPQCVCVYVCMYVCMCAQYVSIPATATVARPERIAPMADVMATLECVYQECVRVCMDVSVCMYVCAHNM